MTFGSLFSGIGGIDLGLERAGMTCRWQVEIDPFCRKVLAKHWPDVERFEDVKRVGSENLEPVDVIAGGFPCQDVSVAGKKAGIKEGTRSGLWFEFHRIIRELRPRYVFVENVPGLLTDGMGRVLSDLAESGYDAEWEVLSARDVGAPHLRNRVFIIAYPQCQPTNQHVEKCRISTNNKQTCVRGVDWVELVVDPGEVSPSKWQDKRHGINPRPLLIRNNDGISGGLDRLKGLGNAVVPQCAEYIGRKIIAKCG